MAYTGVVSLIDTEREWLVVTRLSYREYSGPDSEMPKALEARINALPNVKSLRLLVRGAFIDKISKHPAIYEGCPRCTSYLEPDGYERFSEFVERGGKLIVLEVHDATDW